jgi:hypothetical protein
MDVITHPQLKSLAEAGTPPCVSLFLPTHRAGRDTRQDPVHLKNLLKQAEERLEAGGMRATLARDLLEPARQLIDDYEFWQHSSDGLAIFVSNGFFRAYRIPVEVPDLAVVNDRFFLKPLIPILATKLFYIVAVSKNAVRLLECTKTTQREIKLPEDVALSFEDANRPEDHQDHLQWHSSHTPSPNSVGAVYHGQAGEQYRNQEEDLLFYLRQLDEGIRRVVKDADAPLLIAATDSISPFYRKASEHKNVYAQSIEGNPDHVRNEALHEKALELLQPQWKRELNELQEQFGSATARSLGSSDITEILPAASTGRVGTLFVPVQSSLWGHHDPESNRVEVRGEPHEGDQDLIEEVAVQTLLTNGQVVVVEPDQVPGNRELAAIYRY